VTKKNYILEISNDLSPHANLLIFAISIKNFYKKGMDLEITLPNSIINALSKNQFNTFFTDILLDTKILDRNLNIQVTSSNYFSTKIK
jgi:hypothetical protein